MTKTERNKLTGALMNEYKKSSTRKVYKGTKGMINGAEGFAWRSNVMNRWCFLPLKTDFTIENIVLVDNKNLFNV